jgi:5-methylcytosine-specific restriction endonuclease McrA
VNDDVQLRRDGRDGFWPRYREYLQGDVWRAKRARVLERAGGLCEGCREQPATQVHHLHYRRVFDELLFDLVAVCDECHAKLHRAPERRSGG